ncbi:uncharacterized protein LOC123316710 [Coccinella septempunctata]|uniref:uncharacterized protein LOC123316710 n=1 Tax=Coccinella septempunctata TaxID=41139 RepID=UPI001D0941D8|nr:uncharacterized protein LOC123316710 [Coccinella septempunctata]
MSRSPSFNKTSSTSSLGVSKSKSYTDPDFQRGSFDFSYPNGDKYIGEYCAHSSGLVWKEGIGTYITKDGQSYKGKWYDDKLVDGETVEISFKDGTIYEGPLEKYKYKGAGCLRLPGNIKLILEFVDNKPVGDIILLDNVGRPWYGRSEGDYTLFQQENIYFENIPTRRGAAYPRLKVPTKPIKSVQQVVKKSIDMTALEQRVFKKSEKLAEDYNFDDSEWYRNYINFKQKQQIIMSKVRRGMKSRLTDEEFDWCLKYDEFKERYHKLLQRRKVKLNDPVDLSMFHTLYSDEYNSSKPEFVMYPSKSEEN